MSDPCKTCLAAPAMQNNSHCLTCWRAWFHALASPAWIDAGAAARRRRGS